MPAHMLFMLLMPLGATAARAQASVPVPDSLVAYFPFDDTFDDVRNAIAGTPVAGDMLGGLKGNISVSAACGRAGSAGLQLDGGYVDYGKAAPLNFHGRHNITIMMWIKGTGDEQPTSYWDPISWHHSSLIGIAWQGHGTGTLGAFSTSASVPFTGAPLSGAGSETWIHLTYTRSAAGVVAYVDGVQVSSGSDIGRPPARDGGPISLCGLEGVGCPMEDPTWNVWIGGDPHYRRFHGCIDEVKVFDAALTAEEVGAVGMNAGAGVLASGARGFPMGWVDLAPPSADAKSPRITLQTANDECAIEAIEGADSQPVLRTSCPVHTAGAAGGCCGAVADLQRRMNELEATIAFMRAQSQLGIFPAQPPSQPAPSPPPPPIPPPMAPLPGSLVAYWPFDDSYNDVSQDPPIAGSAVSGDMLGGLTGSVSTTSACAYRGAAGLQLDGGYVNYGKAAALNFQNKDDITIMMWIKGTGDEQPTAYWDPISWHHSNIGIVWQGYGTGTMSGGATSTSAAFTGATLSGSGSDAWRHLTFVRSAAGSVSYVDGVQVGSGPVPTAQIKMCGVPGCAHAPHALVGACTVRTCSVCMRWGHGHAAREHQRMR